MADYGIDVSSFNSITNWSLVQGAGNSWAWSKATQGSGYTNSLYGSQMVSGRHAGLRMGAYHFPDPRVSVATQVRYFVGIARSAGAFDHGAFLPMLDMENDTADGITWSAGGANSFIPAFRDALRAATGQPMLCVYGPESWYSSGFLQPAQWADSGVFLCAAQYTGQPGQLGWAHPRLAVHQYTDSAPTPGSAGLTDRSVILAPYSLSQLTIGATPAPAARVQEDDMFQFIADTSTPIGNGQTGFTRVAMLRPNGTINGVSWVEAASKDVKYNGDGTGSIVGLQKAEFDDFEENSTAIKAAMKAVSQLTGAPGGGTGLGADALTAAVATGVRAGLDGVTESVVLHKPAGS